jgi:hypothetical protein
MEKERRREGVCVSEREQTEREREKGTVWDF